MRMPQTAAGRDASDPQAGSGTGTADAATAQHLGADGQTDGQANGHQADASAAASETADAGRPDTPPSETADAGGPGTVASEAGSSVGTDAAVAETGAPAAGAGAAPASVAAASLGQRITSAFRDLAAKVRPAVAGLPPLIGRHWLASALIGAGLALRIIVWMAYHPAIVYIDSLKYLPAYHQWSGSDPAGYQIPLRIILAVGDLGTVTAIQHLLGLGMAIAIYAVMVRRGAPRWAGALAIAPVLLDSYQLQAEAMIMPDVWFEAIVVAGVVLLLWNKAPRLRTLAAAGFILGCSAGIRQVGEILIVPCLLYVLAARGGWRQLLIRAVAIGGAFCLALLCYLTASLQLTGHFRFSVSSTSLSYGRMAAVVDCATLRIPAVERPLCPTRKQVAQGPDWLEHNGSGPYRRFNPPVPTNPAVTLPSKAALVSSFNHSVEFQQPLRVLAGISRDAVKLFGPRVSSPGDTPLPRWQFQYQYPSYWPFVKVRNGLIYVALMPKLQGAHRIITLLDPAYGGGAQVNHTLTSFLRGYQQDGGYTPGLLFLLYTIAGLAGSLLAFGRRKSHGTVWWQLAVPCAAFFATAVAVLLMSDFFEFTWRYQLPALVTLPPAGALGIAALIAAVRKPARGGTAGVLADRTPELAAPAG